MSSGSEPPQPAPTVLLFGDQTDSWADGLDHLHHHAASDTSLQSFLDDLSHAISAEVRVIVGDRELQNNLGHFSSLVELGDRFRDRDDELGLAHTLLLYSVRAGLLVQWAEQEPQLVFGAGVRPELLGISGGLFNLAALAVAVDMRSLREACLQVGRLMVRVCKLMRSKARGLEEKPGIWGWVVVGITPEELDRALKKFHQDTRTSAVKRVTVGLTGTGWCTIIGPPSVLELFFTNGPAVKGLVRQPLPMRAPLHSINLNDADLDYLVGTNSVLMDMPLAPCDQSFWGMEQSGHECYNWGQLLRQVCFEVLSRPLDTTQVLQQVAGRLMEDRDSQDLSVRVIQIGPSSYAVALANLVKRAGKRAVDVKIIDVVDAEESSRHTPSPLPRNRIAIVGMACRGPGCDNYDEFWERIMNKDDLCTEVPGDRFDIKDFHPLGMHAHQDSDSGAKCTMSARHGCFMRNPGHFDARFFRISPREALLMDPGHRHFLMAAYEALEMAGYSDGGRPTTDPRRAAVYFGQASDDWHSTTHTALGCDSLTLQAVQRAFGPGRLAWQLGWEGPSISVDSACSSATTALHLACSALLAREVDMAVAGGANILSFPHSFVCLDKAGVLSATGNCKPLRADADGYCRADFVGAIVLKRLEDAVAHNDNILGLVAATGRNHSGNATSMTTSDAGAQARLLRSVLTRARVSAKHVSYVELHGTGTRVGDPAEMVAVAEVFQGRGRRRTTGNTVEPLAIGAVKASFGHSEAAAGMAGLIKCLMMFRHNTIPPQVGIEYGQALNPELPSLELAGIQVPTSPRVFQRRDATCPRRILLNSFDAAGGNSCVVLEDFATRNDDEVKAVDARETHVVVTSARTQPSLRANKERLAAWLHANPDARLQDVAYTTTARRVHHPLRFARAVSTTEELVAQLESSFDDKGQISTGTVPQPVVFVFTGQGSHYAGMGNSLFQTSPVFRDAVNECARISKDLGFSPFLNIIADQEVELSTKTTMQTQLAILALEIGLVALFKSIGVQPSMVVGHSLGEYAALHVAGVLSLADVLFLVGHRAGLIQEHCEPDSWGMLSVGMPVSDARAYISGRHDSCEIACINSPSSTVVSGSKEDLASLQQDLGARSLHSKRLPMSFGFHSSQMDRVANEFLLLAKTTPFLAPNIPVASTLLGSIIDEPDTFDAHYLRQQTRRTVEFVPALEAIQESMPGEKLWIELGPKPVCSPLVKATLQAAKVMSTLDAKEKDWSRISKCLAAAYAHGVSVDWAAFHAPYLTALSLVTLATYAWEMKDYWITHKERRATVEQPAGSMPRPMVSTCAQYVVPDETALPAGSAENSGPIRLTLRSSVADEGLSTLISGHRMHGIPIAAGSIICEAAFATAIHLLRLLDRSEDAAITKLVIRNPVFRRPLTMNLVGGEGELRTTVDIDRPSSDEMQVTWAAVSKTTGSPSTHQLGHCTLILRQDLADRRMSWDHMSARSVLLRIDDVIHNAKEGTGHRFQSAIFYALFSKTVEYPAAGFRAVREAHVSEDFSEAVAEVVLSDEGQPTGTRFVEGTSPYWGESLMQIGGFVVNANPANRAEEVFINDGFGEYQQTDILRTGRAYLTYVRVEADEGVDGDRKCEVFVVDKEEQKLIAHCSGVHFHSVSKTAIEESLRKSQAGDPPRNSKRTQGNGMSKATSGELKPASTTLPPQTSPRDSQSQGTIDTILETLVQETGTALSDLLADDTVAMTELGVDSIMSIEIASKVSSRTGLDLPVSFLVKYPTIRALRDAFATKSPPEEPRPSSGPLSATKIPTPTTEDDNTPQPSVRITLLSGRVGKDPKRPSPPPFYMLADGTGTIATYLHLPSHLTSTKMPFYGVDSPFLACPSRLTPEIGIPGIAALIVPALLAKQPPNVPFWLGGFSGGGTVAYEVARQLAAAGHKVAGLLLIDICAPRSPSALGMSELEVSELDAAVFRAVAAADDTGVWSTNPTAQAHLHAVFSCVAGYHPPPSPPPAVRTAIIWARRGHIERCRNDAELMGALISAGVDPETGYREGFMEDSAFGAVAWTLPDKTDRELGANGWERFLGEGVVCEAIEADHLEMPAPGKVHLLAAAIERAFTLFRG